LPASVTACVIFNKAFSTSLVLLLIHYRMILRWNSRNGSGTVFGGCRHRV
jgi:hypothetical protein